MHGNFALKHGDQLSIMSNNGPELMDGELAITITGENGRIVDEKTLFTPDGQVEVMRTESKAS